MIVVQGKGVSKGVASVSASDKMQENAEEKM